MLQYYCIYLIWCKVKQFLIKRTILLILCIKNRKISRFVVILFNVYLDYKNYRK